MQLLQDVQYYSYYVHTYLQGYSYQSNYFVFLIAAENYKHSFSIILVYVIWGGLDPSK